MNRNQSMKIDILIGKGMGGDMGFILQVEERGVKYRKSENDRPILPLFITSLLHEEDVEELKGKSSDYEIEFDLGKTPVFIARD